MQLTWPNKFYFYSCGAKCASLVSVKLVKGFMVEFKLLLAGIFYAYHPRIKIHKC